MTPWWAGMGLAISRHDLGDATSWEEARALVAAGVRRWVMRQGGILALVVPGYRLQAWEQYLVEREPWRFA